jgi:hypothetical protein
MVGVVSFFRPSFGRVSVVGLLVVLLLGSGVWPNAHERADRGQLRLPTTLAAYLSQVGFGPSEYEALEAGRAAARLLETPVRDQLSVVAVIRVNAPPSRLVAAYRDIVGFESGKEVLGMGVFSEPPALSDVASLQITPNDFRDLRSCRVGDCAINLSAGAIERFRTEVNWSSPNAPEKASRIMREMLVDNVARYQREGNKALVVYHDLEEPMPLAQRSLQLFGGADALARLPRVMAYFEHYHADPLPAGAETFWYWQQITFGMKPVTRLNHAVISSFMMDGRSGAVFVSRMIYASHYFRDGLELRYMVPADTSVDPQAFYLVSVSRSHSESLTGFKGFLIGGAVRRHVRDSMAANAAHVKQTIEARP